MCFVYDQSYQSLTYIIFFSFILNVLGIKNVSEMYNIEVFAGKNHRKN